MKHSQAVLFTFLLAVTVFPTIAAPPIAKGKNKANLPLGTIKMINTLAWVFFDSAPHRADNWTDQEILSASLGVVMANYHGPVVGDGKLKFGAQKVDAIAHRYFGRTAVNNNAIRPSAESGTFSNGIYTVEWALDENNNSYFVSSRLVTPTTCTAMEYGMSDNGEQTMPSALFTLRRNSVKSAWYITGYKSLWH